MPRKPKKPCKYPGCPNLTDGDYCEEHKTIARQQYDKFSRKMDINKAYGHRWKKIRDAYAKEHPFCEQCFKEGRMVPLDEVHHIVPVNRGGTHDFSNLMSLCQSCHNKIHIEIGDR